LAFGFGVVFVTALLVLAVALPNPTATTFFIFRVVLALSAAGVGAVFPGLLVVNVTKFIRAGGALGLFVLVYLMNPPALVVSADADLVERGEIALTQGDYASGFTLFSQALTFNPSNWRAYSGMGRASFARASYVEAADKFKMSVEISKGKEWAPLVGLAMAQEGIGDFSGALQTLGAAVSLVPANSPAALNLLFDRGRLELYYWLRSDAPKDSEVAKLGIQAFEEFIDKGGYPTHWALYHLACFKAAEALDATRGETERQRLRGEARNSLVQSLGLLDKYESPRAEHQRRLMRALLLGQSERLAPGNPVPCPQLSADWRQLQSNFGHMPSFMAQ